MADASVVFTAEMDDKQAQAELKRLDKQIKKLGDDLASGTDKENALKQQFEDAKIAAKETEDRIKALKTELADLQGKTQLGNAGETNPAEFIAAQERQKAITAELAQQEKILARQDAETKQAETNYMRIGDKVRATTAKLEEAQAQVGQMKQQLAENAKGIHIFDGIGNAVEKVKKRIIGLAKRVFVFSLISKALRGMLAYFKSAVAQNDAASQAMARLKGALLTLAQPILNILIPAFTAFVNVLTKVVLAVAQFVASLTGNSLSAMASQASALNDEKKALGGVGGAAKKAAKSLASFDEINQLADNDGGGGGGGGTPNALFDFEQTVAPMNELLEKMRELGEDIAQMFRGVKDLIVGIFTGDWDAALDGIITFLDGARKLIIDVFQGLDIIVGNIIDAVIRKFNLLGTPIGDVLEGIKVMFHGLTEFIAGVFTWDWERAFAGLATILEGFQISVDGILRLIRDLLLSLYTWIDGITNGRLHPLIESIKQWINGMFEAITQVFDGLIDALAGAFTKDWERAWNGIKNIFGGIWNGIITTIEFAINCIIGGVNSLVRRAANAMNKIKAPDWVPAIGGKGINIKVPEIPRVTLPRVPALAQGAVIPPNRSFMAVLGDQTSGNNIEAPEALLRQMAADAAGANTGLLREILAAIQEGKVIAIDRTVLGRTAKGAILDAGRMGY